MKPVIIERSSTVCPQCQEQLSSKILMHPIMPDMSHWLLPGIVHSTAYFSVPSIAVTRASLQRADDQRPHLTFRPQDFVVEAGRKSINLRRRSIHSYLDLFSSRQLLVMERAIELSTPIQVTALKSGAAAFDFVGI